MDNNEVLKQMLADKAKASAIESINLKVAEADKLLCLLDRVTVIELINSLLEPGGGGLSIKLGTLLRSGSMIKFIASKIHGESLQKETDKYVQEMNSWKEEKDRLNEELKTLRYELSKSKVNQKGKSGKKRQKVK